MYLYRFAHFQYTQCSESNEPTSSTKFLLLPTKMYVMHVACLTALSYSYAVITHMALGCCKYGSMMMLGALPHLNCVQYAVLNGQKSNHSRSKARQSH